MNLLYEKYKKQRRYSDCVRSNPEGTCGRRRTVCSGIYPKLDVTMDGLKDMSYQETAYAVMKQFLTDFTEEELKHCINSAYDSKFDTEGYRTARESGRCVPSGTVPRRYIAFKDMALSILPHLLTTAAKKNNVTREIVILTATSGDTGRRLSPDLRMFRAQRSSCSIPREAVSRVQELQMVTQKGDNTAVVAIHGNFDKAQSGVKALFEDKELEKELADAGYQFSSANSINIGRLVPQVVYYVYAYAKLLQNEEITAGEEINVTVPTGNFGNILAAYYAKQMGVPIATLICASNENKVLFDFFRTGVYDRNREFILTSSPSMDILISSNLERLIYTIAGQDAERNADLMSQLRDRGSYEITPEMKERLADFEGGFATEEETKEAIRTTYERTGYVMDTHTAVASSVCAKYRTRQRRSEKMPDRFHSEPV